MDQKLGPIETANAGFMLAVNILDALVVKGLLSPEERLRIIDDATKGLEGNSISYNAARTVLAEVRAERK